MERIEFKNSTNPYVKIISEYEKYIINAPNLDISKRVNWQNFFKNNHPIFLEIGSGSGNFLTQMANREREKNYIGLELRYKRLVLSAKKAEKLQLENIVFIRKKGEEIDDIFSENEIDGIFIYFPDPWSKRRTHKHRVIQKEFFEKLNRVLRKDGFIELKTDHVDYFKYVEDLLKNIEGYQIEELTNDLYENKKIDELFSTEFEKLFYYKKIKINYMKIRKK